MHLSSSLGSFTRGRSWTPSPLLTSRSFQCSSMRAAMATTTFGRQFEARTQMEQESTEGVRQKMQDEMEAWKASVRPSVIKRLLPPTKRERWLAMLVACKTKNTDKLSLAGGGVHHALIELMQRDATELGVKYTALPIFAFENSVILPAFREALQQRGLDTSGGYPELRNRLIEATRDDPIITEYYDVMQGGKEMEKKAEEAAKLSAYKKIAFRERARQFNMRVDVDENFDPIVPDNPDFSVHVEKVEEVLGEKVALYDFAVPKDSEEVPIEEVASPLYTPFMDVTETDQGKEQEEN